MAGIAYAHQGVVENRPHDYIYVAGRVDHIKQMTRSQAQQVNMFSALRHYPPMHYKLKINPFPNNIGQDRRTTQEPTNVSGENRFKYFKRPLNYVQTFGGQLILSKRSQTAKVTAVPEPELPSKTIGTQTMYRESEAQTDPYSPDYVFKPDQVPPELLALSNLVYGAGLPVGMAELEMIERARLKRAWEQSLPAVVDQESFELRLKMMEEMELKEWMERETEIKRLQEQRLCVLKQVLEKREEENDLENDKRVEKIWQRKMQEREAFFEKINRKRVKGLRKLHAERAKIDIKVCKRNIIEEYGNFGSKVYAPKARDGSFPDKSSKTLAIEIESINNYQGLLNLERILPKEVLEPVIERQRDPAYERSPEGRREKQLKEQLEQMSLKMKERKERETTRVKQPLRYEIKIERPAKRPATPSVSIPNEEDEEMTIAAHLLQNVLRGRVIQMEMHQNKERNLDLINELRTKHVIAMLAKQDPSVLPNSKCDSNILTIDIDSDQVKFESAVQAEYVGKTLDFLTKELVRLREERRIAAMVKLADRTRRIREANESGLRQEEMIRQQQQDIIFRDLMMVHQETVDTYLEQVIQDSVGENAKNEAKSQAISYVEQINQLAKDMAEKGNPNFIDNEVLVSDLVTSFLIPYADKTIVREKVMRDQKQYLLAAHNSIFESIDSVEKEALNDIKNAQDKAAQESKDNTQGSVVEPKNENK